MPDGRHPLSVLDFGWVLAGQSAPTALRDTFAVARRAEALGYHRFWVGEHHVRGHASGSPLVLASILAASTRRIRVGIGALLLAYYSPLKVAEDARLLETIFGRIDLGVGRGRADNMASHEALLDGRAGGDGMIDADAYRARLTDLVGLLAGDLPADHPHRDADVIPELDLMPEIWSCGSHTGAVEAARLGTRFCCTLFHGRVDGPQHVQHYRAAFRPSPQLAAPEAMVAVCGVCAETEAEAHAVAKASGHRHYAASLVGDPARCRAMLADIREEYGVDEVMFLDLSPTKEQRLRSLELLAQSFEGSWPERSPDLASPP